MQSRSDSSTARRSPMLSEAERLAALHLLLGSAERSEVLRVVRFLLRRTSEHLERDAGKDGESPDDRGPRPGAAVIPFPEARTGLWAAQRGWIQSTPLRSLANQLDEELDQAESELRAIEDEIERGEG